MQAVHEALRLPGQPALPGTERWQAVDLPDFLPLVRDVAAHVNTAQPALVWAVPACTGCFPDHAQEAFVNQLPAEFIVRLTQLGLTMVDRGLL